MIEVRLCSTLASAAGIDRIEAVRGIDIKALLANVCGTRPSLATCLFDEAGRLRPEIGVFVDSAAIGDRVALSDVVERGSVVHLLASRGPRAGMCFSSDWRQQRTFR